MTWWSRCCRPTGTSSSPSSASTNGAHFVSSSYIAPEMRALDAKAKAAGVALVNEVGLDPGIDHLMAHWLVADYRHSPAYDPKNVISFISYCGGVPKHTNAFRYKFSLVAARGAEGAALAVALDPHPRACSRWPGPGTRSPATTRRCPRRRPSRSTPTAIRSRSWTQYGFDEAWPVKDFVRGTLRLNGWAEAWADVFREIETLEGDGGRGPAEGNVGPVLGRERL